jgi:hypothetical protein
MITSKIEICNVALAHLGIEYINSFDEETKQAKACKMFYDNVRKSLLMNLNASFSIERANLVENLDYKPVYGYQKSYKLPFGCLQVLNLGDIVQDEYYQIEGDNFYCDKEIGHVEIRYIKDIDDVTKYDAKFIELFALALAVEICMPLTRDIQMRNYYEQLKAKKYVECSAKYGRDNKIVVINEPKFRNARFNANISNSNYPII